MSKLYFPQPAAAARRLVKVNAKRTRRNNNRFLVFNKPRYCLRYKEFFMALHFQVIADFSLTQGKPSLVSISIYSTQAACTLFPIYPNPATYLTISRIFPTLQLANSYITCLQGVYPHSPIMPPILDSGQLELFTEAPE